MAKSIAGFSLIEVLIALVILAISLMAISFASLNTTRSINYLKQKTAAAWVAEDILTRLQLGDLKVSTDLDSQHGEQLQFREYWHWQATFQLTPDRSAIQANITVTANKSSHPYYHLTGFISTAYRLPTSSNH